MLSEYNLMTVLYLNPQFSCIKVHISCIMMFHKHRGFLNIKQSCFLGGSFKKNNKICHFNIFPSFYTIFFLYYSSYKKECKKYLLTRKLFQDHLLRDITSCVLHSKGMLWEIWLFVINKWNWNHYGFNTAV